VVLVVFFGSGTMIMCNLFKRGFLVFLEKYVFSDDNSFVNFLKAFFKIVNVIAINIFLDNFADVERRLVKVC
jgi:hypothetical protein